MTGCDVLIIGAGIAGAGAAYELAVNSGAKVVVLEREAMPGYHTTGRSAATYTENYGPGVIRHLTKAGKDFLESPPEGFAAQALLRRRGMVTFARAGERDKLMADLTQAQTLVPEIHEITLVEAADLVPVLRIDSLDGAIYEPGCCDLDVHGLHQGFLKGVKAAGGAVITNAEVTKLSHDKGLWTAETKAGRFTAPVVVNAAGAWADVIATLAGVQPIGLIPKRRTVFTFDPPDGMVIDAWPMAESVTEDIYFKPDAGRILASPADATPVPPQDVQPEELDLAIGIDRIEKATTLTVGRPAHKWAGLRTFAADGSPVAGFDDTVAGFFWLAGQGGYGIKTSPALSRICAGLITKGKLPKDIVAQGVGKDDLATSRLRAKP